MFKNYFKVALRNLTRQKLYVAINVLGLAIGLAGCLLIIGFVNNELTFENVHTNKDRIYRIDGIYQFRGSSVSMASIQPAVGPAVKEAFPEVENMVRLRRLWDIKAEFGHDVSTVVKNTFAAEPSLFEIFTLPLAKGDPATALNAPYSAVISKELMDTYYSGENPLGRTIRLMDKFDCEITGVLAQIPVNTQLGGNIFVSYATLDKVGEDVSSWTNIFQDYTYVLLNAAASPKAVEEKIPALLEKNMGAETAAQYQLQLQPLKNIYLHSNLSYELFPRGDLSVIYIFSVIAVLILVIASINFINLTTARTGHRVREVGVRKVLGAFRGQLVKQFISESILITFIAMLFGLVLFELTRPLLESFIDRQLRIELFTDPVLVLSMFGMILIVGVLSGSYPAFILSRFQPSEILKGTVKGKSSRSLARRILVVFQFTMAVALVALTLAVYKQIDYSLNSDLGYDKDNVLLINVEDEIPYDKCRIIRDRLVDTHTALDATVSYSVPGENRFSLYSIRPENKMDEEPTLINGIAVDYDFCSTFELQIIEGRNFSEENPSDVSRSVLINETAIKELEIENPIGFKLYQGNSDKFFEVIGVVKDFHVHSLKNMIMANALILDPGGYRLIAAKLPPGNMTGSISQVKEIWNDIVPGKTLDYRFLDDAIMENYEKEQKLSVLFTVFSALAILVACLGIFGLSAYTAEQRTKEIGIRKVLGATVAVIVKLLSREFVVLVVVANIIAWPLAFLAIDRWLEEFAYRMHISWTIFIIAGVAALTVALLTVSYQALRAALANPVKSLKQE
ncbi:MAG: ABC transporter permease [candidate division Zixibacteria bacterium]|nr:ABC transporter permease [candidate division Zixibacteria bacterium]